MGRPTEIDGRTKAVTVTLDDKTIEKLRRVGQGNLSAGIREAARRVKISAGKRSA